MIGLNDVKSYNSAKGFVNYYIYALTTVKARVLNKLLHSLLDGKIMNIVSAVSWTDIPTEVMDGYLHGF
jgi:hypothetical protein